MNTFFRELSAGDEKRLGLYSDGDASQDESV